MNVVLLAVGLALCEATSSGWQWVAKSPGLVPAASTEPGGAGWFHLGQTSRSLADHDPQRGSVELWWNPIQTATAIVIALIVGFVACWLVLLLVRAGVALAHSSRYRGEQRMTAALHYSTAWCIPLFVAALVVGLRPICFLGRVRQWSWCPPDSGFILSAAVVAGFALTMWWFWLIRIAAMAPEKTRGVVVAFLAVGAPLIAGAATAGWWLGIRRLYDCVFAFLRVEF